METGATRQYFGGDGGGGLSQTVVRRKRILFCRRLGKTFGVGFQVYPKTSEGWHIFIDLLWWQLTIRSRRRRV